MVASVSFGRVAQLVEHLTFNQVAPGSNPGALTKLKRRGFPPFFIIENSVARAIFINRPLSPNRV